MGIELLRPWWLLIFPLMVLAILLIDRKYGARGLKARVTRTVRVLFSLVAVLSLCGVSLLGATRAGAVWLVMDVSESTRNSREEMEALVASALSNLPSDTQAGVIAFGGNAMVETALSDQPTYQGQSALIDAQASDLNGALRLAGALLPSDASGQVVVLTDGQVEETDLSALTSRNIAVDARIFPARSEPDAQAMDIKVPSSSYEGQRFSVEIEVQSNMDTNGTLVLYANRQPVQTREIAIRKGSNRYVFTDTAKTSGVVTYSAQVIADGDQISQNNQCAAYMVVGGAPGVLLVEGRTGEGSSLRAMLDAVGIGYETITPERMPSTAEAYRQYDAVLLVNADADAFDAQQLQALSDAVRVLGRGLCVFGGDSSYALGGYRGSALEEVLPVTIDVKNKLDMPSLALMLVIDKSGSMTAGQFGTTRLELAKEAAMRAAEVLTENDQVGVIAFDDAAKWVVNLQSVTDVNAIQNAIGTIRPGGGTAFYTALYNAYAALSESDAQQRHVIFLTDGEAGDGGYESVVSMMAQEGITLTTVAVGEGANASVLRKMAETGKGRAYVTNEFDNVPKIFTKETYLVSGSYVQNRVFTPVITEEDILTDYEGLPQLTGYLATTEKPLAHVALVSDRDEPLLAWWQYGAGKSLAWTSDTTGGWTVQYLSWADGARFFGNMVSFVLPEYRQSGTLSVGNGQIAYTAPDEVDAEGKYFARVLTPAGDTVDVPLTETAPDVYASDTAALPGDGAVGAYAISIYRGETVVLEGGYVENYSGEYDLPDPDKTATLEEAIAASGGRLLTEDDDIIRTDREAVRTRRDLTDGLLWIALALFVLDVALRRLSWERALEKYLNRERPVRETQSRSSTVRPSRTANRGKNRAKHDPGESTGQLLDMMKNRKKM